jgi:stringent starvation protein B
MIVSKPLLPTTKPYFLRALHEWCCDHGFTPYLTVAVDATTIVPKEYVKDDEITLNVSPDATGRLSIDNEAVQFSARFNGTARDIWVPMGRVAAIYARENGVGMGFDVEDTPTEPASAPSLVSVSEQKKKKPAAASGPKAARPSHLQRVK